MASKPKARPKKKPAKKPETRGRPTKYNASWAPKMALIMASSGMIDKDMAEAMGVHKSTFDKWKNDHLEFKKALKKGKATPDTELENSLFKSANGYFVDETTIYTDEGGNITNAATTKKWIKPDGTSLIFALTNRKPEIWKRLKQVEIHATIEETGKTIADALSEV